MDRRSTRRQARLETMLDAAMAIASAEGLEALTIVRLCDALHLSVGGLYRYFPSKEAIHVALQARTIGRYDAYWRTRLAEAERVLARENVAPAGAAVCRLLVLALAYLDHADDQPLEHRLMDAFLATPDPLLSDEQARFVNETLAPVLAGYAEVIAAAAGQGVIGPGDPVVRTHIVWAALHGLDHFRKRDRLQPPELQVPALARVTLDSLLQGWGAPAAALDEAWQLLPTLGRMVGQAHGKA